MSPNIKNTLISFFSFFLIAFSLYIFISLLSYDSSDSGYWYRDSSATVNNLGGPLGAFISDYLFNHYPKWREGDLALNYNALVCKETCSEIAEKIGLGQSLIMGKSESKHGGRLKKAILADAIEALIAAVYLDSKLSTVKHLILKLWSSKLNNVGDIELDPKTALQHWVQEKKGGLPNYTDMKREGSDHDPIFYVEVKLENGLSAIGKDKSKRKAQQNAAQKLLSKIKIDNAQ